MKRRRSAGEVRGSGGLGGVCGKEAETARGRGPGSWAQRLPARRWALAEQPRRPASRLPSVPGVLTDTGHPRPYSDSQALTGPDSHAQPRG